MKKALVILGIVSVILVLMLAMASVASADNGPHGNFGAKDTTSTTDSCAGCHRAHTATAENLLRWGPTQYDFCTQCHGPVGQGAVTNVVDGKIQNPGSLYPYGAASNTSVQTATTLGLNGGGFENAALYIPNTDSFGSFTTVNSRHDVEGVGGSNGFATAWGGGVTGPGLYAQLECASCHDPHGSPNYRILNQGYGHGAKATWTLGAGIWSMKYSTTPGQEPLVGSNEVATGAHNYASKINVFYDRGISDFCGGCHTQYLLTDGNDLNLVQSYDAGDGNSSVTRYRHPVASKGYYTTTGASAGETWVTSAGPYNAKHWIGAYSGAGNTGVLRRVTDAIGGSRITPNAAIGSATSYNGSQVTCLTCHYAHGSAATTYGWAQNVAPANDSANLFLDNRGVCQSCHGKGSGTGY